MLFSFENVETVPPRIRHSGIACDACKQPVVGVRHKCIECSNLDLCERCISLASVRSQHKHTHTFFPIEYPWDHHAFFVAAAGHLSHPLRCALCSETYIRDVHYAGVSCCRIQMCTACHDNADIRSTHPVLHSFRPKPSKYDWTKSLEPWAQHDGGGASGPEACNGCSREKPIEHRCLECASFGLCSLCIMDPRVRMAHDPRHHYTPTERTAPLAADSEGAPTCDGCRRRIVAETFHRCLDCADCVLCLACTSSVRRRVQHNITHRFFPVEDPSQLTKGPFAVVSASLSIASCSSCGVKRGPVQHRCLVCSDFSLCWRCTADRSAWGSHDEMHPFFPYTPKPDIGDPKFEARREQLEQAECIPCEWKIAFSRSEYKAVGRVFYFAEETSVCFSSDFTPWPPVWPVVKIQGTSLETARRAPGFDDADSFASRFSSSELRRAVVWGLVHMVVNQIVSTQDLFRFCRGPGAEYILFPPLHSAIPLQWMHVGPNAIPNALADTPCSDMDLEDVLGKLNSVQGTAYALSELGLRELLDHALRHYRDFGEVYGMLRKTWPGSFFAAVERLQDRAAQVQRRRDNAYRGDAIHDSEIHPRRVWDLFSNRVLPFHAMLQGPYVGSKTMPAELWTVSHSWVEEGARVDVTTAINGRQWPVPVPRGTTLENVRIELLNLGAEYVWLDVLCLRQVDDATRQQEWALDIPTIGHIFQAKPYGRPCLTYFNGLGLPLDTSRAACASPRHWFQRMWTLQETVPHWLPGGLTRRALYSVDETALFARLEVLWASIGNLKNGEHAVTAVISAVGERHCTTELDRIAGLARCLQCTTLPVYTRTASLEDAWAVLRKHMPDDVRMAISAMYQSDAPFGLWPSWKSLLRAKPALPEFRGDRGTLKLVDDVLLYVNRPGVYCHAGRVIWPFIFTTEATGVDGAHRSGTHLCGRRPLDITTDESNGVIRPTAYHGHILPDIAYSLISIAVTVHSNFPCQSWAVAEVVGRQRYGQEGKEALVAVRWAVIQVSKEDHERLKGLANGTVSMVVYLSEEEALAASQFSAEYMQAYGTHTQTGREVTTGE